MEPDFRVERMRVRNCRSRRTRFDGRKRMRLTASQPSIREFILTSNSHTETFPQLLEHFSNLHQKNLRASVSECPRASLHSFQGHFFIKVFQLNFEMRKSLAAASRARARSSPQPEVSIYDVQCQYTGDIRARCFGTFAVDVANIAPHPPSLRSRRRSLTQLGERRRRRRVVHPFGEPERARLAARPTAPKADASPIAIAWATCFRGSVSVQRPHSHAARLNDRKVAGPVVARHDQVGDPVPDVAWGRHRDSKQHELRMSWARSMLSPTRRNPCRM